MWARLLKVRDAELMDRRMCMFESSFRRTDLTPVKVRWCRGALSHAARVAGDVQKLRAG